MILQHDGNFRDMRGKSFDVAGEAEPVYMQHIGPKVAQQADESLVCVPARRTAAEWEKIIINAVAGQFLRVGGSLHDTDFGSRAGRALRDINE